MIDTFLLNMEELQFSASPAGAEETINAGVQLYETHRATSIANSPPRLVRFTGF